MNKRTVAIIALLVLLIGAGIMALFKPKQVNSAKWNKSYSLYSDQPYGLSVFKGLLEHKYSPEAVNICDGLCPLPEGDARGFSYIYVGSYFYRAQSYIDKLVDFTNRGGRVLIISEHFHLEMDSIPINSELKSHETDEVILRSANDNEFTFKHIMFELDSTIDKSYYAPYKLDTIDAVSIDTLLTIEDSIAVFSTIHSERGHFTIHSLPAMFSNVSMKYGDGLRHFNYSINYSDQQHGEYASDTLLLDSQYNQKVRSSKQKRRSSSNDDSVLLDSDENNVPGEYSAAFNPIQFIFANPSLKWSYLIILIGGLTYIYFTGKRRQQAIPTLEVNKNTSVEFVDTLSDLFRSQNNPSRLVDHIEENLKQFIKRKYFIDSNSADYYKRVSQKSKIDEEEISTLFKRIEAAKNNMRFREEQLVNLNQTIEEFYKKCQ